MSIRLAIASDDSDYLQRLSYKLQDFEELQLSLFEDTEKLKEALTSKRFDILLFTPSIYPGECVGEKVSIKLMLYDEDDDVTERQEGIRRVRRYQRISYIYNELLEAYSILGKPISGGLGKSVTKLISFYSPVGGSGKTTLALAAATRIAREGRSVFYVNLEDMPSDEFYLPNAYERGMTDLIHGLGNNMNAEAKLRGLMQCKNERLYYTKHFDSPNDLKELSAEETSQLLNSITSSALFDYVIVDMSTRYDDKTSKIFEISDEIVVVERGDEISEAKMASFYSQLFITSEYGHKMKRVVNFNTGKTLNIATDVEKIGEVYMTQVADPGAFIDQLAGNQQMAFVSRLMQ